MKIRNPILAIFAVMLIAVMSNVILYKALEKEYERYCFQYIGKHAKGEFQGRIFISVWDGINDANDVILVESYIKTEIGLDPNDKLFVSNWKKMK